MTAAARNPMDTLLKTDANFAPTGERILWRNPRDGNMMWSYLYQPTAEAARWDGAPEGSMAVGTRHGFAYVTLARTGRTLRRIPTAGAFGTRCRITFNAGTEDEATLEGWTIELSAVAQAEAAY